MVGERSIHHVQITQIRTGPIGWFKKKLYNLDELQECIFSATIILVIIKKTHLISALSCPLTRVQCSFQNDELRHKNLKFLFRLSDSGYQEFLRTTYDTVLWIKVVL